MAGTFKLDGKTFLSKSGSDFTVDVGTDGSYANGSINLNVTFPAGHILQVVHSKLDTNFSSTTAGAWLDVGQKATITPSSTSSKVFVIATLTAMYNSASNYNVKAALMQPVADSDSNVVFQTYHSGPSAQNKNFNTQGPSLNNVPINSYTINGLDSPNSTSALTYGIMIKGEGSGTSRTHYYNQAYSSNLGYCGITLMEVAV